MPRGHHKRDQSKWPGQRQTQRQNQQRGRQKDPERELPSLPPHPPSPVPDCDTSFTIKFEAVPSREITITAIDRTTAIAKGKREWYATLPEPGIISVKP